MKQLLPVFCAAVFLAGIAAPASRGQDKAKDSSEATAKKASFVKNVDASEADKVLHADKKIVVLDIRTPKEYQAGHIVGATNINFYDSDFQKRLATLDKNQTYLVHCAVGGRSAKARDMMQKMQFQSIYHLDGGLKAWEAAGKPVEKGK